MLDKINIITDIGDNVEATAPIIISASRSTDIPAFYAKWFSTAWQKGIVFGTTLSTRSLCIFLSKM